MILGGGWSKPKKLKFKLFTRPIYQILYQLCLSQMTFRQSPVFFVGVQNNGGFGGVPNSGGLGLGFPLVGHIGGFNPVHHQNHMNQQQFQQNQWNQNQQHQNQRPKHNYGTKVDEDLYGTKVYKKFDRNGNVVTTTVASNGRVW